MSRTSLKQRFLKFYDCIPKNNRCWEWPGTRDIKGYGKLFNYREGKHIKIVSAHRVSYEIHCGPIPPKMEICHHCDNPPCVRPSHLFPGTHFQNMRDGIKKGSFSDIDKNSPTGEQHCHHKLSEKSVHEILNLYAGGNISMAALAKKFHVSIGLIHGIIRGTRWKHVVKSNKEMLAKSQRICRKLTDAQFANIKIRYSQGERPTDLARIYGVTASRIIEIGKHGY